jgi:ankyrin repeat protein
VKSSEPIFFIDKDVLEQTRAALRENNVDALAKLVAEHHELVSKPTLSEGFMLLHAAAGAGLDAVMQLLLKNGASANARTDTGGTPLHFASDAGHSTCVALLLEAGAEVNAQSAEGFTPLFVAAQENKVDCARLLLAAHAQVNLATVSGDTPLLTAAAHGNTACLKLLLEAGAVVDACGPQGITPLFVAAQEGQLECVEALLSAGANKDAETKDGTTVLHTAARGGDRHIVQHLLDAGADPNAGHFRASAVHLALIAEHFNVVKLLLSRGAKANAPQGPDSLVPLFDAIKQGNMDMVDLLLDAGADVQAADSKGFTALHTATLVSNNEIVEVLIRAGANVNAREKQFGLTPLCMAYGNAKLDLVQILLEAGAEPFMPANLGRLPNHLKIVDQCAQEVRRLLPSVMEGIVRRRATASASSE